MVKSTMTETVPSRGRGRTAAAMAQNEQTMEEHSTLEQQSPTRLDHPAWHVQRNKDVSNCWAGLDDHGTRSFIVAAPTIWNSLPPSVRIWTSPDTSVVTSRPTSASMPSNPLNPSPLAPQIRLLLTTVCVYKLYLLTYLLGQKAIAIKLHSRSYSWQQEPKILLSLTLGIAIPGSRLLFQSRD